MSSLGVDITFVLPRPVSTPSWTPVRLVSPRAGARPAVPGDKLRLGEFEHVSFRAIDSRLGDPYARPEHGTAADRTRRGTGSAMDDQIEWNEAST